MSIPVQQCQPCLILVPTSRCLVTRGPSLGTAGTSGGSCSFGAIPAFHRDPTRFCTAGTVLPHQTAVAGQSVLQAATWGFSPSSHQHCAEQPKPGPSCRNNTSRLQRSRCAEGPG